MVNNIKTFEERVKELVEEGKKQGFLTYEQIAKKTIDLDLDANALDELYNALSENQIEVRAEDEEDGGNRTFILVCNNESNICRTVTNKRLQKISCKYVFLS